MNPLSPVLFWLAVIAAWFACRWVVRTLSAGFTQVRANRSVTQFGISLRAAAGKENPR